MAKVSKATVDKDLREKVFEDIFFNTAQCDLQYIKINDRQYGVLIPDLNGEQRYVRIGAIVAELREDLTAEELMQSEINAYHEAQEKKLEKQREKEAKIAAQKEGKKDDT